MATIVENIEDLDHLNIQDEQELNQPWYKDPNSEHQFDLFRHATSQRADAPKFQTLTFFPWNDESLGTLWKGSYNTAANIPSWRALISEYWDAVAVGSSQSLYVFFACQKRNPICVPLPQDNQKLIEADNTYVQWGLSHYALFQPVVMVSRGSVMYIVNIVLLGMAGTSRGHGGAITSITLHPTIPNRFCTTSRDQTTRLYDLELQVLPPTATETGKTIRGLKVEEKKIHNPHWPPSTKPSFAGAPHGLRLVRHEGEGSGIGRCNGVMVGGRAGGHNAAVLGAAFHPNYPILATCGMDRCVKLWPVRPDPAKEYDIKLEDKPLFSSSRIHKASVLSVTWVADDLLLTHSAPAIMRRYPNDANNKETYIEPGELILWRWLGLNRFFPPIWEDLAPTDLVLRGGAADYRESSSFKLISIHSFPEVETQYITPKLNVYQSPTHDAMILFTYSHSTYFAMINICHLEPKKRPPFPPDAAANLIPESRHATPTPTTRKNRKRRADSSDDEDGSDLSEVEETLEAEELNRTPVVNGREELTPPGLEGWRLDINDYASRFGVADEESRLMNAAMGVDGQIIVGVGTKGSLWVWRQRER